MDKYQQERKLGDGAYGDVSLLKNINTNSYTALKRIDRTNLKTRDLILVMNEIIILKSLDNLFINRLKNNVEERDAINIMLEYESGGDLFTVFVEHFKEILTEKQALFYVAQIAIGVEYLHAKEVVHRDLKLENILVSFTGFVKICDFGFACIGSRHIETCGTLGYLCPEIINNQVYTNKVDVWCLGVIAYELVYGCNPFTVDNEDSMFEVNLKTLTLKYPTKNTFLHINDFLKDILVKEHKRYIIDDVISSKWFRTIDILKLNRGIYLGDIPYVPSKKKPIIPNKRLRFVNNLIKSNNEFISIVVFDTNNNYKCLGYNQYFKDIFKVTDKFIHLEDYLKKDSPCLTRLKKFLGDPKNERFIHTKIINGVRCNIDCEITTDNECKRIIVAKLIPLC